MKNSKFNAGIYIELKGIWNPETKKDEVHLNGIRLPIDTVRSPGGYTWGYRGGGPSALAGNVIEKLGLSEKKYFEPLYSWIVSLDKDKPLSAVISSRSLLGIKV
jgi:hypothetical protein